jgi:DNA polymerase I-like protein with 3'-5' exonuclease and polymerase domains
MDGDGNTLYTHFVAHPWGREYAFKERVPPWGGRPAPVPSEVVNYPIQGFATGDVVPLFLALLQTTRALSATIPNLKMINCVHDSVVFECPDDYVTALTTKVHGAVDTLNKCIPILYGVDMHVDLTLEVEVGKTWK